MTYVPIFIEDEESSLWKIKLSDWEQVKKNIEKDACESGYKHAHFDDWNLMYSRDWSWSAFVPVTLIFFLGFFFWFATTMPYEYRYSFTHVFGLPIFFAVVVSALITLGYCALTYAFGEWLNVEPCGNIVLLEVFGSKIWRETYAHDIGLELKYPPSQEVVTIVKVRCRYCGRTYPEKEDKCPYCGGQ